MPSAELGVFEICLDVPSLRKEEERMVRLLASLVAMAAAAAAEMADMRAACSGFPADPTAQVIAKTCDDFCGNR